MLGAAVAIHSAQADRIKRADVSGLTFHNLRGTAAVRLAIAGASVRQIAAVQLVEGFYCRSECGPVANKVTTARDLTVRSRRPWCKATRLGRHALQFARILDEHHPVGGLGDFRKKGIGQRGLASRGTAGDQNISALSAGPQPDPR